ncbi:MAG: tetratricopeptide repeat protein, partial [Flavobacteriales bacterium]
MKNILILLFCFITLSGLGQNKADSLISILPSINDFRLKSKTISKIYWKTVYSKPAIALKYCDQLFTIGKQHNSDTIIANSYNLRGIVYDVISESDSALMFYDSTMKYAIMAKDTGLIAGVHNNTGLIHWNNGLYEKALNEYLKSETIYLRIGNNKGLASCYSNIGLIYSELDDFKKAIKYQNKALSLHEKMGSHRGINSAKLNLAINILVIENPNSMPVDDSLAFDYLSFNEKSFLSESNYYALGKVYSIKATYYNENEVVDSAYKYGEKAIDCYRKIGAKNLLASSLFNSCFYVVNFNNDRDKANKRVEEAYEIIKETGSSDFKHKVTYQLANIYSGEGKFEEATKLYRESVKL